MVSHKTFMKRFVSIISLIFLMCSCSDILFKSPQPLKQEKLGVFPNQLVGTYAFYDDEGQATLDTFVVKYNSLTFKDLSGEIIFQGQLNKNVYLAQDGNLFILSVLDEAKTENGTPYYSIYILEQSNNRTFNVLGFETGEEEEVINRLKSITPAKFEAIKSANGVTHRCYLINPTKSQLMKLIYENVAVKFGEIRRVR